MNEEGNSPLKRFQAVYCQKCGRGCNPNELAFLVCILAHGVNSLAKISEKKEEVNT